MAQKRWKREQIPDAIRQGQMETSAAWRPFNGLKRYLADCWPNEWERIRGCSMSFLWREDQMRPGYVKRLPVRCNRVPFCITCSRFQTWTRVQTKLEEFYRCTPAGKEPRFYHVVQTAPFSDGTTYPEGGDWGRQASEDVGWFRSVVWAAMRDEFGKGVGGVASYQDFGEGAFTKRHPHLDMTINGWMLQDGEPVQTPRFDFQGQGRKRWDERVVKRARARNVVAARGNANVYGPVVGVKPYVRILKYQLRELVDLRKLTYDRDKQLVYWMDYRSNRRTPMTVWQFADGLHEYRERLGAWKSAREEGTVRLHTGMGHMAPGSLKATQKAMGGEVPPHGSNCVCSECGDWLHVELTDEEIEMNRPVVLNLA